MKIYIAKDYDSYPLGLVLAKSKEVAQAFFTGKYGAYDTIEEIDPSTVEFTLPGVPCFNIIETHEHEFIGARRPSSPIRVINRRGS